MSGKRMSAPEKREKMFSGARATSPDRARISSSAVVSVCAFILRMLSKKNRYAFRSGDSPRSASMRASPASIASGTKKAKAVPHRTIRAVARSAIAWREESDESSWLPMTAWTYTFPARISTRSRNARNPARRPAEAKTVPLYASASFSASDASANALSHSASEAKMSSSRHRWSSGTIDRSGRSPAPGDPAIPPGTPSSGRRRCVAAIMSASPHFNAAAKAAATARIFAIQSEASGSAAAIFAPSASAMVPAAFFETPGAMKRTRTSASAAIFMIR